MNVRSGMRAMLAVTSALVALLAGFPGSLVPAGAQGPDVGGPRVTIAMLPQGTGLERLVAAAPRMAPGLLSAGLGQLPAGQTYLDIGQGSRLSRSLYPEALPPLYVTGNRVPGRLWKQVRERAEDAPARLTPGLLAETLLQDGVPIAARPLAGSPALIAADRIGRVRRTDGCEPGECPGVTITSIGLKGLAKVAAGFDDGDNDLLIAIERPPVERDLLAIGLLGRGFEQGDLTSPTTRMNGFVVATDLLPTILARYGIAVPDDVTGREIETTGGESDAAGVADLERRLGEISERRWGVLAVNLLIWAGLVAAAAALGRRRGAAAGLSVLAVAMAYVPAILLLSAGLAPSAVAERLLVGVGAPIVAGASVLSLRRPLGERAPFGAFALAAAVSVGATAVDMIFGSPLTALSLLGPNPALGVRFFGIGNELEATIAVLLMLGAGAAVTAWRPADPARAMAIAAVAVTTVAVLVFAPGRLGADVGAAITFPAGGAAAVIAALGLGRRRALLVLAAPVVAVALLVAIDLISGGDAHLSRTVLGSAGSSDVGDVMQRRITAAAGTFPRYIGSPFFIAALVGIVAGIAFRKRVKSWFAERPAAQAAVIGAAVATLVGTLANDSGALLLMVGTGFIAAFCGLAWAARGATTDRPAR